MTLNRTAAFFVIACLALLATGCSNGSGIQPWQKSVETYVADKGGDADALRDVTLADSRHGFALNGGLDPRKSTDTRGLLIAHQVIADRPWFIYVVGVVKEQKLDDLRVTALSVSKNQSLWSTSNHNSPPTKLYRDWGWNEWHKVAAQHTPIPPAYTTFPREGDVFEVIVQGDLVQVTHKPSGAHWTCDLSPAAISKSKS